MSQSPYLSEHDNKNKLVIDLHDGTTEQVSIIIVHKDRPEYLSMCVQSIHVMSNLVNYEVVVVDNASGQESQEYLDALEEEGIRIVRNKENFYWSKAANLGAAVADKRSKYLLFLHCDTIVLDQSWIDVMINIAEARNAGLVGVKLGEIVIAKQECKFVQGWCMMFSRDCWNDCGPWPEELPLMAGDFIMTLRAQIRGYNPTASQNALIHHYRIMSTDPNEYERFLNLSYSEIPRLMEKARR
jgi:GT2 family glycosyltransferase